MNLHGLKKQKRACTRRLRLLKDKDKEKGKEADGLKKKILRLALKMKILREERKKGKKR